MKINVGVPVYNGARTLGKVLDAILTQVESPKEVIVVDDGSTDNSASIALGKDVRVLSHRENLGLAQARNTILWNSDADILVYFDADAAPKRGCIGALVEPLAHNRDVAGVGGRGLEAGTDTRAARWRARTTPQSHGDICIYDDWMLMGLCTAFRRKTLLDIGGFDATFSCAGEDVDISLRIREKGGKLVYVPDAEVDHLPSGNVFSVTSQAYRHAKFAGYALVKNNKSPREYLLESARCLGHYCREDFMSGHLFESTFGLINAGARALGITMGSLRAKREQIRGAAFRLS